jgi:hypothetical protein
MPSTRQLVTDKLLSVLSDPVTGFNARFAAVAESYGVDNAFEIDWTPGSLNFAEVYLSPDQIEMANMLPADDGVCVLLYTSTSVTNSGDERQKPSLFSGKILAHVDFILKRKTIRLLRQGVNLPSDTAGTLEKLSNSIEDAFLSTVMDSSVDWAPVSFNGDFQCSREPFLFGGDGWQSRIPFQLMCEVHA